HGLAGRRHVPREQLRVARSRPGALEQGRRLLGRLPSASGVAAATAAGAAREAAESGDPRVAAIASGQAATLYGLVTLEDDVGDGPAFTRFVSLAPYNWLGAARSAERTALTFVTEHRPWTRPAATAPFSPWYL